jgi:hypothetical protein
MPAGDAHRTWFREMIEMLRMEWNSSMSNQELISLRDRLDATLQAIRTERNILPPMECQKVVKLSECPDTGLFNVY